MTRRGMVLGAAAGAVLLLLGAPRLLRRATFFQVRQVELAGGRYLSAAEVTEALALPRGLSLFDSFDGLAERVRQIPGIRSAEVGRRWPGTLVVQVSETEPVALTPHRGKLALMDETGTILPFDPTRAPADLPVAQRDPGVGEVLARVRKVEPELFAEIEWARRAPDAVVLETGGRRYLLDPRSNGGAVRALAAVARDLERRGRGYRELDARFEDRVFVRGGNDRKGGGGA